MIYIEAKMQMTGIKHNSLIWTSWDRKVDLHKKVKAPLPLSSIIWIWKQSQRFILVWFVVYLVSLEKDAQKVPTGGLS